MVNPSVVSVVVSEIAVPMFTTLSHSLNMTGYSDLRNEVDGQMGSIKAYTSFSNSLHQTAPSA